MSLFDSWTGSNDNNDQEAPVLVIVIAVVVGGLITAFCVGAVVWMIMKVMRKNKEALKDERELDN